MERRTIEELVVRYELEPHLADVYVEGQRDRDLIEWLCREAGLPDVVAYEIETVDVPPELLVTYGLHHGNRGRVITLANELEQRSSVSLYHTVACVADGDYDHFMGSVPTATLLIVTDFTAPELYLFNERALGKFLRFFLSRSRVRPLDVIEAVTGVLQELFFIRTAAHELGIALAQVDFDRSCRLAGMDVVFDRADYVKRYLNRDGFASRTGEFLALIEGYHSRDVSEKRHTVHGHDLVVVIRWYCKTVLRAGTVPTEEVCARAFQACAELADYAGTSLLEELAQRFSATGT